LVVLVWVGERKDERRWLPAGQFPILNCVCWSSGQKHTGFGTVLCPSLYHIGQMLENITTFSRLTIVGSDFCPYFLLGQGI
jgi:hypothetical protein